MLPVNKIQHALVTSRRPRGGPGDLGRLRIALCAAWRGTLRAGRTVGLFGLIAWCAAYDEGAIGDWGALHLRQDHGTSTQFRRLRRLWASAHLVVAKQHLSRPDSGG